MFYLVSILSVAYFFNKNRLRVNRLLIQKEKLEGQLNISKDKVLSEAKNKLALEKKIVRYHKLKEITEEINRTLSQEAVADKLVSITFSLVGNNLGTCRLYLADPQTQKLRLFKAKREGQDIAIKEKEGDAFDHWVLRHTSCLFIENTKNDFRFDPAILDRQGPGLILSLISAPLISETKFIGIIRLDNPQAGFYSQDDLRLLVKISELGAVALENGQLFKQMQQLARRDGLTSLYTRSYFVGRLKEEFKRSALKQQGFCLLMVDIDYFKNYNDKYGHSAGDIVLRELSSTIRVVLKGRHPVIGRFGGEEFLVILPQTAKKEAFSIAQNMRQELEKIKVTLRRQDTRITVSVGIAAFPEDASSEQDLIFKADQAMYLAKQKGRNRVCLA